MDRVPPQSLEAEQALLGSMLLDKDAAESALEIVTANDLYHDAHRQVYQVIAALCRAGEAIDLITVTERLRKQESLEQVGGASYISTLANSVPSWLHWEDYAKIVLEKSKLRRVIATVAEAAEQAYDGNLIAVDTLQAGAVELEGRDLRTGPVPYADSLLRAFNEIEERCRNKNPIVGIPSGYIDLDHYTAGWQKGDLIIVGGRPSMGKSAFGQCVAEHAAKQGYGVLFITLEMTPESLMQRAIARVARVSADRLRKGLVQDHEWTRMSKALGELSQFRAWTFGPVGPSPVRIKAAVRKLQREGRCDLVVVDYLQLLSSEVHPDQRQLEIGQYTRAFKWLALEFKVPVIVLAQLSRAVEATADKRPQLQHLRESGNIEQDADVVLFLWREDYYKPETDRKGITEVIIAKQRNGPVGTVELRWNPEFVSFENLERRVPA
ncbi:MAG: replicative DNA helicase [Clostridia bacterium]|nr:replicative DNA helicase [Clostridia bacterium]